MQVSLSAHLHWKDCALTTHRTRRGRSYPYAIVVLVCVLPPNGPPRIAILPGLARPHLLRAHRASLMARPALPRSVRVRCEGHEWRIRQTKELHFTSRAVRVIRVPRAPIMESKSHREPHGVNHRRSSAAEHCFACTRTGWSHTSRRPAQLASMERCRRWTSCQGFKVYYCPLRAPPTQFH